MNAFDDITTSSGGTHPGGAHVAGPTARTPFRGAKGNRNFGLDLVRATAITLVLFSHFFWNRLSAHRDFTVYPAGVFGVELFFVLSGYLIGGILLRAGGSIDAPLTMSGAWRFWVRRWFRTLPNYYVYLLLYLLNDPSILGWRSRVLSYWVFGQNFAWPITYFFGISWSLTIEEWEYLLLPLTGLAFLKAFKVDAARRQMLYAVICLILIPTCLRLFATHDRTWDEDYRKIVVFRLDAIAIGVALAWLKAAHPRVWERIPNGKCALAGTVLAAGAWIFFGFKQLALPGHHSDFFDRVLFFPWVDASAALLIIRASRLNAPRRWLAQPVISVSVLSYSLYLCHWLVVDVLTRSLPDRSVGLTLGMVASGVAASLLMALVTYAFVERPFLKLRDKWFP